jgi:hypothetical protein
MFVRTQKQELNMRFVVLFFVVLFSSCQAPAAELKWAGVWSGTIGNAPVMVCLNHRDYGEQGAYYYKKYLEIITLKDLKPADGKLAGLYWMEGFDEAKAPESSQWQLTQVDGSNLTGTWTPGSGRAVKPLPIKLSLVLRQADEFGVCDSAAFNALRATPITLTRTPAKQDGVVYTKIIANLGKHFDASIETFELAGNSPAIKAVNADLRREIPADPAKGNYFECITGALNNNGSDGDYSVAIAPILISRNYMVSEDDRGDYCGGAHPNSSTDWKNWDLRSGKEINLWDWFSAQAISQKKEDGYNVVTIEPALRKVLDKRWRLAERENDCDAIGRDYEYWSLYLMRTGIGFAPSVPHALIPCADSIDFTFAEITPLLSPAGKKAMAAFRADLSKK